MNARFWLKLEWINKVFLIKGISCVTSFIQAYMIPNPCLIGDYDLINAGLQLQKSKII